MSAQERKEIEHSWEQYCKWVYETYGIVLD